MIKKTIESIKKQTKQLQSMMLFFNDAEKLFNPTVLNDADVKVSDRVIGGKVERINSAGELEPVEDGTYQIGEDFLFETVDSVITYIDGQEAKEEEKVEMSEEGDAPKEEATDENVPDENMEALQKEIENMVAQVAELKEKVQSEIEEIKVEFSKELKELSDFRLKFSKVFEQFSKTPVDTPKTTNEKEVVEKNKEQKIKDLGAAFAKLK